MPTPRETILAVLHAGLGGQLRVLPGAVIGWDMSAALALGVPRLPMSRMPWRS